MKKCRLALAAITLFGAACGSSNTTIDGGAIAASIEDDGGETASGPQASDDGAGAQGATDWCEAAAFADQAMTDVDAVDFTDPEATEQAFNFTLELVRQMSLVAPDEIEEDVDHLETVFAVFAASLEDVNWVMTEVDFTALNQVSDGFVLSTYNFERYNFYVCDLGNDPGEPPVPGDESMFDILPNGTIRDQAVAELVAVGLTREEAECISMGLDFTNPEQFSDTSVLLDHFAECDISTDRLSELGTSD